MGSRQKSTVDSESDSSKARFLKMEAIKKKMQAMKVEKDNACDQADVSEEKMKAARIRAQKGEDEVEELLIKSRQLETGLDMTAERLGIATLLLATLSVPRRSSRARPTRTRRGLLALKRTSKRRGRRPRPPTPPTMRSLRSLPHVSPISRRLRSAQMWVRPRSSSWRRS